MAKNFRGAYALTGGATGALDAIDGAALVDKEGAVVITQAGVYIYALDADSAAAESSPDVIEPDANGGDKRWILQFFYDAVKGDGTSGRVLRRSVLTIDDGTNADTLKCTLTSVWNGDTIAETDNVPKGGTAGNFTLNAGGTILTVEAAGLAGNAVAALSGEIHDNTSTVALQSKVDVSSNDLRFFGYGTADGAAKDLTVLVDTGSLFCDITYLTDA